MNKEERKRKAWNKYKDKKQDVEDKCRGVVRRLKEEYEREIE